MFVWNYVYQKSLTLEFLDIVSESANVAFHICVEEKCVVFVLLFVPQ